MFDITKQKKFIDVIKYRWVWVAISIILLLPGIFAMGYLVLTQPSHAPLNVGIDFTGGTILQYSVNQNVDLESISDIRQKLKKNGVSHPIIQLIKSNSISNNEQQFANIISIRTHFIDEHNQSKIDSISKIISSDFKDPKLVNISSIGPTLGAELFQNSVIALFLAFIGIVVYLAFRFQLDFAVVTLITLFHDALFIIGLFALLGIFFGVQVDALFITALLTVIGFSVHDTIVVFDRIRENCNYFSKKLSFSDIVNLSVNQTLARSINTSFTTVLTLLALYLFGGSTTKDFVLAMLLGIIVGTYSSIFVSSMLVAWHKEYLDRKKLLNKKIA